MRTIKYSPILPYHSSHWLDTMFWDPFWRICCHNYEWYIIVHLPGLIKGPMIIRILRKKIKEWLQCLNWGINELKFWWPTFIHQGLTSIIFAKFTGLMLISCPMSIPETRVNHSFERISTNCAGQLCSRSPDCYTLIDMT